VVALEDHGERRLGIAMLEAEHEFGHDAQLVSEGVGFPIVDIGFRGVFVCIVTTVAEAKRRSGFETKSAANALHESVDACK
jgi:hypothetical protein